jgi:hypothetical protein
MEVSTKAFFHFSVEGFPEGSKIKLLFRHLSLLNSLKVEFYLFSKIVKDIVLFIQWMELIINV